MGDRGRRHTASCFRFIGDLLVARCRCVRTWRIRKAVVNDDPPWVVMRWEGHVYVEYTRVSTFARAVRYASRLERVVQPIRR